MSRPIDLTGFRTGMLVALFPISGIPKISSDWLCACDCGKTKIRTGTAVFRGNAKSCGCQRKFSGRYKHGQAAKSSKTTEYKIWCSMKNRCYNKNDPAYTLYGARGIKVCLPWRSSFESFLADMGRRPFGMTLERINNHGNYEPPNCKWSSRKDQANNRRSNRKITLMGKSRTLSQWASMTGTDADTISMRLKRGWKEKDAILKPARKIHAHNS